MKVGGIGSREESGWTHQSHSRSTLRPAIPLGGWVRGVSKAQCASSGPLGVWVPALASQAAVLTVSILLLIFSLIFFKAAHRLKKEENPAICDSTDEPGECYAR